MRPTYFNKLQRNTRYYIVSYEIVKELYVLRSTKKISEGIFVDYTYGYQNKAIIKNPKTNVKRNLSRIEMVCDNYNYSYGLQDYIYYNADLIKQDADQAKLNREKRTVNMILQKITGDELFVWYKIYD